MLPLSGDGGMKASGDDGCGPGEHRIAAGPVTAVPQQRKDYREKAFGKRSFKG